MVGKRVRTLFPFLFCLCISFCFQQLDNPLFELSLNDDFSIFHRTSHTTFGLEQLAQFFQVIFSPYKSIDKGNSFASPAFLLDADTQFLLLLIRSGCLFFFTVLIVESVEEEAVETLDKKQQKLRVNIEKKGL